MGWTGITRNASRLCYPGASRMTGNRMITRIDQTINRMITGWITVTNTGQELRAFTAFNKAKCLPGFNLLSCIIA